MENTPELDHALNILYNMEADICIGKNLHFHLSVICKTLVKLALWIRLARINEDTLGTLLIMGKLVKMENEILVQLKNPE